MHKVVHTHIVCPKALTYVDMYMYMYMYVVCTRSHNHSSNCIPPKGRSLTPSQNRALHTP